MSENQDESPGNDQPQSQEIRHSHVGALVPAHVARGVFSTGAVVLQGQHEFILDFLLRMQQPQQVVARIVIPPSVVGQFIAALKDNLNRHETRFGPVQLQQQADAGQNAERQSAQDLYDQLKLPETVMSGDYANAVMIGHTATEFSFDFITTFFPRSAVAQRVFLAAPNAKRLLDSLLHSFQQFQQRLRDQPDSPPQPPPMNPSSPDGMNGPGDDQGPPELEPPPVS